MLLLLLATLVQTAPRVLTVGAGGAWPTIAEALAAAGDGDTVRVRPGVYREGPLRVTRRVTLLGEPGAVVEGRGDHPLVIVTADSVTVRRLELRHVEPSTAEDRPAIRLERVRACRVEEVTVRDAFFGVYLSQVTGCLIRGNRVAGSATTEALSGNAIHSWSSSGLVIEDNVLEGHRDGVYFEFTSDAVVRRNRSHRNLRYGLHFMFSDGCTYRDNEFTDNRAGIAVMYSRRVIMEGNRFEGAWGGAAYGLLLKDISDSRLARNRFRGNSAALFGEGLNRVEVTGNEFLANGWAVRIMADAQETAFRGNRFEGNSFDVSTNSLHAATLFQGNYWDRYAGYDLDRDGVGDVPFAPVRLFALVVQQHEPALILLRSFFVSLLELAERVAPVLTPRTLVDTAPLMRWPGPADAGSAS